jgi:hypothetical protein
MAEELDSIEDLRALRAAKSEESDTPTISLSQARKELELRSRPHGGPRIRITEKDVADALGPSVWDLGNEVLYRLCREHPKHDQASAILAKVWLIGRSYAAAIERRKNATGTSDHFYRTIVVEGIRKSGIDAWLAELPDRVAVPSDLRSIVVVHKRLMDLFQRMTGLEKRSLASKYLHFHRPNLFFIYDSRARNAIARVTPRLRQVIGEIEPTAVEVADPEYQAFCLRAEWLRGSLTRDFGRSLTPRDLDKVLLWIADRDHGGDSNDLLAERE